jgi:hypothetical protein
MPIVGQIPSKNITFTKTATDAAIKQILDLGDAYQCTGAIQLSSGGSPSAYAGQLYGSLDGINWTSLVTNVVGDINSAQMNYSA